MIHNAKITPWLRGEGVTAGKFFELGTWRRDGLMARLRERGFNVRTIPDRIAALRAIEPVRPLGAQGVRALSQAKERIATFDRDELRWRDLPLEQADGRTIVRLRAGQALRRRKSRGKGDYYLATLSAQGEINLLPVSETEALLYAYAQLAQDAPITLRYATQDDMIELPRRTMELPAPHQAALDLLTLDKAPAWSFPSANLAPVREIFAKLGIQLAPQSAS